MTGPINTDTIRANAGAQGPMSDRTRVLALCDEVDSLRAVRDAAASLMNEVLAQDFRLDPAEEVLKAALDALEEADRG